MAEWRRLAGESFAAEHRAAELALLTAYAEFGEWLSQQIESGAVEAAFFLMERQRRTMGRLLGVALAQRRYGEVQALLHPLDEFWKTRGLQQEARTWLDRCRAALEDGQSNPPDLTSEAGALWLFTLGSEANWAILDGELDAAFRKYDAIRQGLEALQEGEMKQRRLAVAFYQLAMVAQDRGDLDAAEGWYRKALTIKEELGDRPGLASTYHQLGMVALRRGDLAAAEQWCGMGFKIFKELGNWPGLAASCQQLGSMAQIRRDVAAAEGWYRKALEIAEALGDQPGLASTYLLLGTVAQERGDFPAAEGSCRKALEINVALSNRPGLAASYGQLGLLAEKRGDLTAALEWIVHCVALFPDLPHPATRPALQRLARSLGLPALEASWQRCIGRPLSEEIRAFVANTPDEPRS